MRVHGDIMPIRAEPISHEEAMQMMSEICGARNWEIFEQRGDLDFAYEMDEASRFRSNYFKQSNGYGAAFRLIPTKIATLEELGIPVVVKEFADLRGGLVLVTGPTGSGKTTTQAALIDYINQNFAKHVVTIEEPIEFVHDNKRSIITQREVPADSSSFAAGLKAALREDTDIVLVGEMRDLETVSLALTAAETGLLVFGTLHTNNARKTVDRMVDVFPADRQPQARAMLANSLRGVVAQLLLKKSGSARANRGKRNPDRERRGRRDHSRRRNAKTPGRDRIGQSAGDAVHGRRDLGAARKRHCLPARSFHESDRQKPVQTISLSRGRSARQRRRFRPKRRKTASRQSCETVRQLARRLGNGRKRSEEADVASYSQERPSGCLIRRPPAPRSPSTRRHEIDQAQYWLLPTGMFPSSFAPEHAARCRKILHHRAG